MPCFWPMTRGLPLDKKQWNNEKMKTHHHKQETTANKIIYNNGNSEIRIIANKWKLFQVATRQHGQF